MKIIFKKIFVGRLLSAKPMKSWLCASILSVAVGGAFAALGACSSTEASSDAGTVDAGDGGARGVDPFCRTRPRLSFCEDFDEKPLPGAFDAIEGDGTLFSLEARKDAPSEPNVAVLTPKEGSTDARFVTLAKEGIKYNVFFLVRPEPGHGRVDLAGLEDGAYKLVIGIGADDTWYVEETTIAEDGGTTPTTRVLAPTVKLDTSDLAAVRLDVYVDGPGKGHMRFRSGDDVLYETEPLVFPNGKATLTPKVFVGAKRRDGAPTKLALDSVTLGED